MALRLPSALKFESKELCIERGNSGDLIVYDPVVRERAYQERRKRWDEIHREVRTEEEAAIAAGASEKDFEFPRFEQ